MAKEKETKAKPESVKVEKKEKGKKDETITKDPVKEGFGERHITDEEIEAAIKEDKENAKKKNPWVGKLIVIGFFIVLVAIYFMVPTVHEWVNSVLEMFRTGNFSAMRQFIAKYGKWAMLISSLLMIFQSLAAPLPAFFITLTNANLFGWWQGCILSWASSMAGAVLCFYIARILGRDIVEKICTKGALLSVEQFFEKYGTKCILIARLLPFISFDVVSYAAGLTAMDFWSFFIATGVGQMPACIVYSYVGGMLTGGAQMMFIGLLCLFALAILVILIRQIYQAREAKRKEEAEAAGEVYVKPKFNWTQCVTKTYASAFIAMTLSMLLGKWAWLNMRINMGWIFLGLWVILALVLYFVKRLNVGIKFSVANVAVNVVLQALMVGTKGLFITPASRIREGLMLSSDVSFHSINTVILILSILGMALVVFMNLRKKPEEDASPVPKKEKKVKESDESKAETVA